MSPSPPSATEEIPASIAKYRITGVAGRGAMGVVYIAHDPFVDRQVAIKVATHNANQTRPADVARRMFFNEARSAGVLDHPNILRVFDAGEDENGQPYMVMEYIEAARTLKDFVVPGEPLAVPRVLEWMRQCADALECAHSHGVVHRDIKPANLLVTTSGNIKVGDFGVAQRLKGDETQVMGWFGSPQYMSPEQARDEDVTPCSDLFSLGSVMYELLTGKRAFEAKGISGLLTKLLTEEPPTVTSLRPEVPESVVRIINRCLKKKAVERYPDAASLREDLTQALSDITAGVPERSEAEQLGMLKELTFLNGFPANELREILKAGEWRHFASGGEIIQAGAKDQALHVIVRGSASINLQGQRIAVAIQGEIVGEIAYVTGLPRSANVQALERTEVLTIQRQPKEWASLACQLRIARALQIALAERLWQSAERIATRPV